MSRLVLLAAVLAACGCANVAGPRQVRNLGRADAPGYTIDEQERRGRERLAITEDDRRIGPSPGISRPSPTGR